ncbi:hypothetical protein RclHR1_38240002 [Rhizophagus clarus]|uniref:Uncharacterized protein n=1 Tax=Rhizophagus clarus TaxID=94130 RepID=A0A2Z6S7N0_9GLOM|nr:hypothetical protein RclHR1_10870006 [Rhizophagus clarus]GBC00357.1 hypothetical protein RclHR1_38240002 [Rhizophagus clarus]
MNNPLHHISSGTFQKNETTYPKTRGAIVYSHNCGHSSHTIAKQLGSQQKLKSFIKENNENRQLCSKKIATTWIAQTKQPISRNTIR